MRPLTHEKRRCSTSRAGAQQQRREHVPPSLNNCYIRDPSEIFPKPPETYMTSLRKGRQITARTCGGVNGAQPLTTLPPHVFPGTTGMSCTCTEKDEHRVHTSNLPPENIDADRKLTAQLRAQSKKRMGKHTAAAPVFQQITPEQITSRCSGYLSRILRIRK